MSTTFESLKVEFDTAALSLGDIQSLEFLQCGENQSYGRFAIMSANLAGQEQQVFCSQLDLGVFKKMLEDFPAYVAEVETAEVQLMEDMKYPTGNQIPRVS